jgi:hypothetical protein
MLDITCPFCEQTFNVTKGDELAAFSHVQVANPIYPQKASSITGICAGCREKQEERMAS